MNPLTLLLAYLFWPNPAGATYGSPKAIVLMIVCVLLIAASIVLSVWRKKTTNTILKKLSRSWSTTCFWLGFTGLIFIVARVEQIQFISMRVWWVLWIAIAVFYVYLQFKFFRARYYEVLPATSVHDPRSKYLPKRKR